MTIGVDAVETAPSYVMTSDLIGAGGFTTRPLTRAAVLPGAIGGDAVAGVLAQARVPV